MSGVQAEPWHYSWAPLAVSARRALRPSWTADQVIDEMLAGILAGKFYIVCPDNDVTADMDRKRIRWAAQDLTENRPPLSRWDPAYADAFAEIMARGA